MADRSQESTYSQSLVDKAREFSNDTAPAKMRVHAFAKALGLSSKELIAHFADVGVAVKTASSSVTAEQRALLIDAVVKPSVSSAADVVAQPAKADEQEVEPVAAPEESVEPLVEVVPPITPPPASPAFAVPVFVAPQPTVTEIDQSDGVLSDQDGRDGETASLENVADSDASDSSGDADAHDGQDSPLERKPRPRRRRSRRRGRGNAGSQANSQPAAGNSGDKEAAAPHAEDSDSADRVQVDDAPARKSSGSAVSGKTRVTKTRSVGVTDDFDDFNDGDNAEIEEPKAVKGSTRLEAQRRRREERKAQSRKRHIISEAEFLARRESVERTMVVRERARTDHHGTVTQVGVLEDDILVEHFVTSDTQTTQIGNIYLGRVQNVLPSMEAAFVDIGTDRNAVLYAGDLNWKMFGNARRSRRIEHALKSGDQVLVQVTKDPLGHKGARLSTQISLAGRFLVYVPGGRSAGISRKLPESERRRLKEILKDVTPDGSGTIIRTAAENMSREDIKADVDRLETLWQDIDRRAEEAKARRGAKPLTLYEEPDMLVKVVRDLFNEDFSRLVVEGDRPWHTVKDYVDKVAPELADRLQKYSAHQHGGMDVFEHFRIDEQLAKALERKVWLPSGGTLVIDRTEAMTVVDVNTGKFTGAGGNLEETVTRNNLEAAEEIVRQMRLRDLGGMIVVDFIDMVLPENQDLVLRRLKESLGRDRTRHEVSEVTSLGLVQMTRKRLGTGLLETFSTCCEACNGRGLIIHVDPVEQDDNPRRHTKAKKKQQHRKPAELQQHPVALAMTHEDSADSKNNGEAADVVDAADTKARDEATDAADSKRRVDAAVDAIVAATVEESEQEEKRPPRRNRRRAGTRVHKREEKRASHEQDSLAAVAAAAVAEAREADPDEPSDDRYVAHTGGRRRRRRAVRVNRVETPVAEQRNERGSQETQDKPAREETAPAAEQRNDRGGQDKPAGRRRRRAVRRVTRSNVSDQRTADSAQQDDSTGKQPAATGKRAAQRKDETTQRKDEALKSQSKRSRSRRGNSKPQQTFEEAKAEFDSSPRRKRPTRGNSRSDHAPKPEDFAPQSEKLAPKAPKSSKPENSAPKSEESASKPENSAPAPRRRRRVARKTSQAGSVTKRTVEQAAQQKARTRAKDETREVDTSKPVRRRGRRAVRRTNR